MLLLRIQIILLTLFIINGSILVASDIVLMTHADNTIESLSRKQIVDIYMGRRTKLPNGDPVIPIDLPESDPIKTEYYRIMINRSLAEVNAYWSRLYFTGKASPPRVIDTVSDIKGLVSSDRKLLAYIPESMVDKDVKIVYRLKEG